MRFFSRRKAATEICRMSSSNDFKWPCTRWCNKLDGNLDGNVAAALVVVVVVVVGEVLSAMSVLSVLSVLSVQSEVGFLDQYLYYSIVSLPNALTLPQPVLPMVH
jgi:hypothetical protein